MILKKLVVAVTAIDAVGNTHHIGNAVENVPLSTTKIKLDAISAKAARLAALQIIASVEPSKGNPNGD